MNVMQPTSSADMSALRFRVVTVGGQRRGIKLEEIYWSSLSELAARRSCKLADIISECEQALDGEGNLTARLRYVATSYLREQLSGARERSGLAAVAGQVRACPSPAFALTGDKRIIAYNPAFLTFVQSRFLRFQSSPPAQGLRLSFDVQFAELVDRLKASPGEPQPAGFTIGINEHVTRGRLSAALASLFDQDVVIGFISA
ncbi:ribbon-helix-helix domain-containing protein [Sinorhizobium psoraleae]|uniref:Ribbon-helix-helix domain-containing protein n=1 Tax=Sinorhizobium psoraleae TaxID=520838 RepID=A0ABT4KB77_9HYPH|nr:ribbon-helix-helix domain-containing protein [Sinorhizobium psoraleae]MCZ4089223.1 ribbon-helix-helix domain-containing protein [Sinorhizobium psoraleae]